MRLIDADSLISKVNFAMKIASKILGETVAKEIYTPFIEQIELETTIEQPEWISCADRLPECEWGAECPEPVIYKMKATGKVYAGYYGTGGVWRDRYFRQYHNSTNGVDVDDVACWMYQSALPEPPKGDE